MQPEDIERRDFFVGLRGYDRDEVHQFLAEVAAGYREVFAELDELRSRPLDASPRDPFEDLGANVTAILRAANESAGAIAEQARADADVVGKAAQQEAAAFRERTATEAAALREEAEQFRSEADTYAGQLRREADTTASFVRDEARADADALVVEARAHVAAIEAEAEERGRERAFAATGEAIERLAQANARREELRARLAETSDEIQLALMALGEPMDDPHETIRQALEQPEPAYQER